MQPLDEPTVTWEKATMVLNALVNIAGIREVLVFGSVAREENGNDLDIVLVVDIYTYINFLKEMWASQPLESENDYYFGYRQQRVDAVMAATEMTPAEYGWLNLAIQQLGAPVDLHVMPEGWQQNIDAVQTHLPHADPQFVRNIAGDAKQLYTDYDLHNVRVVGGLGERY